MMRVYKPLTAEHPLVTDEKEHCCLCEERFKVGAVVTLIPEAPGPGTVPARPAHIGCLPLAQQRPLWERVPP
jgi:hypothetical protein